MQKIGIGLAGFGTVGGGVYKNLIANGDLLSGRLGLEFEVLGIALRDPARARAVTPPAEIVTTDWRDLVANPDIAVIVELMGGIDEPLELIRAAINAGKIVVTGNKALLAEKGPEIFALADAKKIPVFYEAAVAGGIPIIKAVCESFVGNRIEDVHAIINGTSNYILTRMEEAGLQFEEALAEAQSLGFAEADPALDINGWDAAHKAVILASLAYGFWVPCEDIHVEGIEKISALDIQFARRLGYSIKLLAIIRAHSAGDVEVRVHPALIPRDHVLASVKGVFNAIRLRGDVVGESLFYGRGAGQDPTASAVIADLADAATALHAPCKHFGFTSHGLYGKCRPMQEIVCQYYLRLSVADQPGTLARVASILGRHSIGISSVIQPENYEGEAVPLVLMIHDATDGVFHTALAEIAALDCVKAEPAVIRVEHFNEEA